MNAPLQCGHFQLALDRPLIMGIVNLTDDSFSGDGLRGQALKAIAHGLRMAEEGADLLDLGAESSRPGAEPVSEQQEMDRLLPVIEGLRECGIPLSVDTVKPGIMSVALSAGADMINDIFALQAPGAFEAVAASNAAVCLMHMQGEPRTMQSDPRYGDVVTEVASFLDARVAACMAAGIDKNRIVIDPGFGFGKTLAHNLALLRHLDRLVRSGLPVLAGLSRKSMFGLITGHPIGDRMPASIAAALLAVQRGAAMVRVHDVAATRDALLVMKAIEGN
ncbi:MAG: dihydropteroate synthase [Rhodocyclaceae bacterium]|nr:dihydropteroate synthase [Rhodocyclaceae bacterium]